MTKKLLLGLGLALLVTGGVAPGIVESSVAGHGERIRLFGAVANDAGYALIGLGAVLVVIALTYHILAVRHATHRFLVPLALIVISTGIALAGTEVILHLMYRDTQVGGSDSPSGFTFYPKYYVTNNFGFRDVERRYAKPDETFRIVVLGDSFTFGSGVKFKEDLYSAQLEERLNALSERPIEVINTGRNGLNTRQQIDYLATDGLRFDPDVVIVGHVLNDAETPALQRQFLGRNSSTLLPERYHRLLNAYSFTYYLARLSVLGLLQRPAQQQESLVGYDAYLANLYAGPNIEVYGSVVDRLASLADEHDFSVYWLSFPRLRHVNANTDPFAAIAKTVQNIAKARGFEFVALRPSLRASGIESFTVSAWDDHPNETVHDIAAAELAKRLTYLADAQ